MNANDLMQVYYLDKEIQSWKSDENIKEPLLRDKVSEKIAELENKKAEILDFIFNIDDSQTRLIFKLRCLDLLSWNKVADVIGGMNSEYTVKKRFYRYLQKNMSHMSRQSMVI